MMKLITQMNQTKDNNDSPIYFIKNKNTSKSDLVWKFVEREINRHGIAYVFYETEYEGHAKAIAEEILRTTTTNTLIVAVGGDGTVHEIVNGAASFSHAVVACIPAGSGNDYSRGIQNSTSFRDVLDMIQKRKDISSIDMGEFVYEGERRHFINSLGIGFDASISKAVNTSKWKKRFQTLKLGKFIYLYFFIQQLFSFNTFELQTVMNGKTRHMKKVWFLVVANQPYFGGGIKISPQASVKDGKLHVIVVRDLSPFMLLLVFASVFWGGHLKLKWVESFVCEEIHISTKEHIPIQADGEHIGYSSIRAKILPSSLRIIH